MKDLTHQRCFNHEYREAVAICLECDRFFCRECITEHEDRVLCASCLSTLNKSPWLRPLRYKGIIRLAQFLSGSLALWIFFYYLGQVLLSLPTSFHEGTLWTGGI
ncbi:MAG: rhomboid family protein [Thermodesulfobacteriota bacterium]|nr:rhomboid family protein [Thermodesulfobacteriota bacterium]